MNSNTRMIALVIALALPVSIAACAQTRTSDSTGEYIDDATITTKVKAAILEDSALKVMQIDVKTDRDTVRLTGSVDTPLMIARAGEVARHVDGVVAVQNDLVVK